MNRKNFVYPLAQNLICAFVLACPGAWACYTDPLIIDLGRDRLKLADKGVGVAYDFMGWDLPAPVQWVKAEGNEAFLVRDHNQNGIVDNGQELFGDNIRLQDGSGMARNGFQALAQFDLPLLGGNDDGLITADDVIWHELALWLDIDGDGVSTDNEIITLESQGIKAFDIIPNIINRYDRAGNRISLWDWVHAERIDRKGKVKAVRYKMYDVTFAPLPSEA
ncbi:hypothetical protein [Microbulbifer sediminum]|uniref:hypothetical protein n=1 Tax=Microbulbifer sediminum TaxID=2904250 RepID=UPI001F25E2B8|nr:hypothetical protein [Microbulbifer sediminum]